MVAVIGQQIGGQASSCDGKIAYGSEKSAVGQAYYLRWLEGERNIVAYPCQYCGFWHVGHV